MTLPTRALRYAALCCHAALLGALVWASARAALSDAAGSSAAFAAAVLPLVATLPALIAGRRRVEQWIAVLLVVYAGAACVEVIASSGAALLASVTLLAALGEIGLLFAISRAPPLPPPTARERTEP